MTREIFERRLELVSFRQQSKIGDLIEDYRRDLCEVHSTAVSHWLAGGVQGHRASSVIARLGETTVESLAATIAEQKLVPETSLSIAMVQGVLFAESMVIGRLQTALKDSRLVPQPQGVEAMEEVGPPYRVCDAAYLALRWMLNPESYLQHLMEKHHFLSLSDATKNREIESWVHTSSFTQFLDATDAEEE
jgi:hypothetical protein